jgi:hypothetical protein
MSRKTTIEVRCDVCGGIIAVTDGESPKKVKVQLWYDTAVEDGYPLSESRFGANMIEICYVCLNKAVTLTASGAQGLYSYRFASWE